MTPGKALSTAALIVLCPPAFAQGTAHLAEALAHVPAAAVSMSGTDEVWFVDIAAQQALAAEMGATDGYRQMLRLDLGAFLRPVAALRAGVPAWEERAGIPLSSVNWFAGTGAAPYTMAWWGFADDAAATALFDSLSDHGFDGATPVRGNGEPLAQDFARRDPASPWVGEIGQSSFVGLMGNALVQGATPQSVSMTLMQSQWLGDAPHVATALAGLEAAVGEATIVQAMVMPPTAGIASIDPASILLSGGDMDDMRSEIEAQMEALRDGLPPWLIGIVADVQADAPGVAVALTFPDCTSAETAAGRMVATWAATIQQELPGQSEPAEAIVTEGPTGQCAATLTAYLEAEEPMLNMSLNAVMRGYMYRSLAVVRIGTGP